VFEVVDIPRRYRSARRFSDRSNLRVWYIYLTTRLLYSRCYLSVSECRQAIEWERFQN